MRLVRQGIIESVGSRKGGFIAEGRVTGSPPEADANRHHKNQ
jgi:hypothetical protein